MDSARNDCIEKINEGTILKIRLDDVLEIYNSRPKKRKVTKRTEAEYKSHWGWFLSWMKKKYPTINYLNEIT